MRTLLLVAATVVAAIALGVWTIAPALPSLASLDHLPTTAANHWDAEGLAEELFDAVRAPHGARSIPRFTIPTESWPGPAPWFVRLAGYWRLPDRLLADEMPSPASFIGDFPSSMPHRPGGLGSLSSPDSASIGVEYATGDAELDVVETENLSHTEGELGVYVSVAFAPGKVTADLLRTPGRVVIESVTLAGRLSRQVRVITSGATLHDLVALIDRLPTEATTAWCGLGVGPESWVPRLVLYPRGSSLPSAVLTLDPCGDISITSNGQRAPALAGGATATAFIRALLR